MSGSEREPNSDEAHTPDLVDSERDVLMRYLAKMRGAVVRNSESLTDSQLRAPGVPSGTNLLGIIQHLTGVEEHWFRMVFLGEDVVPNLSMEVPADRTRDEVVAAYLQACARSDEIIHSYPLATMSAIANPGEDQQDSLRLIVAHMVEETGRHAGQTDILRELIDGATEL